MSDIFLMNMYKYLGLPLISGPTYMLPQLMTLESCIYQHLIVPILRFVGHFRQLKSWLVPYSVERGYSAHKYKV